MLQRIKRVTTFALIAFFSLALILGCADLFAPGMRENVEQVASNVNEVIAEQGALTSLVSEGQAALQARLDEARASIEGISFRSEEDRTGAEATLASFETTLNEFGDAAAATASGLDEKIAKYYTEAQSVAEDFAAADTPGAALSVFGELLIPFLGPYAPVAEIGLSLLGLGGAGRHVNRRAKTKGATSVLAPIEKARNRSLEAKLTADDAAGRKYVVFDTLLTKPVFDANGAGAIIDGFSGFADRAA